MVCSKLKSLSRDKVNSYTGIFPVNYIMYNFIVLGGKGYGKIKIGHLTGK